MQKGYSNWVRKIANRERKMCIAAATLYLAQALRHGVKNALILAWHLCMASEYAGMAFTQQSTLGLI